MSEALLNLNTAPPPPTPTLQMQRSSITIEDGKTKIYFRPGSIIVSPESPCTSKCITYGDGKVHFEETRDPPASTPVVFKGSYDFSREHKRVVDGDFTIVFRQGEILIGCKGSHLAVYIEYTDRKVAFTTKF